MTQPGDKMESDSVLIMSIRKGDEEAFRQFFESFYPSLTVMACKCLKDKEAARDIVQEAFIYFWGKREEIYSIPSARYYLYKYVKHRSLNYLRDRHPVEVFRESLPEPEILCRDEILEEESYQALQRVFDLLTPQGRRVIELTLDGHAVKEIAGILGVTVNTVKTLKLRAFRMIRNGLDHHHFTLFLACIRAARSLNRDVSGSELSPASSAP